MSIFFVPEEQIHNGQVVFIGQDVRHLVRVLRTRPGDRLDMRDGKGRTYAVEVTEIASDRVTARIVESRPAATKPFPRIWLGQAVPKNPKMEWIVQKCVEVGVTDVIPVLTERSVPRYQADKKTRLQERWQRIAREAAKQCGCSVPPTVMPIADLDEGLDVLSRSDLFLLPWEGERRTGLRDVLRGKPRSWRSISILIGPEGGFSRTEVERAVCSGARTITLGQRIFRTETAGMIASALVLFELGQLGPTDKAGGVDR